MAQATLDAATTERTLLLAEVYRRGRVGAYAPVSQGFDRLLATTLDAAPADRASPEDSLPLDRQGFDAGAQCAGGALLGGGELCAPAARNGGAARRVRHDAASWSKLVPSNAGDGIRLIRGDEAAQSVGRPTTQRRSQAP